MRKIIYRIIDGKRYDTTKATEVAEYSGPCGMGPSDFRYHETSLFKTKKGSYFLAGKGGPMSLWSKSCGNGSTGGEGIRALSANEAREWLENHDFTDELEEEFGAEIGDA